jgi:hypothetical protein
MRLCFLSGLKEVVGQEELDIDYRGGLSGLLKLLCERYGDDLRRLVQDPDHPDKRNPFLKVLVDGEDRPEEELQLVGSETVFLFLPIAGG